MYYWLGGFLFCHNSVYTCDHSHKGKESYVIFS